MSARRRTAALATALVGLFVLTACSHDDPMDATDLVANAQAQEYAQQQAQEQQVKQRNASLPVRPSGVIDIDGSDGYGMTRRGIDAYVGTGAGTQVRLAEHGEQQAFKSLCSGTIDMVSSLRPISESEWQACRDNGLDVVRFQIASDAIVVAVKSESDVGGDCLTTDQVQEAYRAGSPVTSWSQLGFDDIPMTVAGPPLGSTDFAFFAKTVLGSPTPAVSDVRSDYQAVNTYQQLLDFVTGGTRNTRLGATYADRARERSQLKTAYDSVVQAYYDAAAELRTAKHERAKGIRDKRSAADQAKDQARLVKAQTAIGTARAARTSARQALRTATTTLARATDAKRKVEKSVGHVVYTHFSDYEVNENRLRPFEITEPDGHRNCVFPSQRTVSGGEYPFSAQVVITTTTRALQRNEVRAFLREYLSKAETLAAQSRLVPLPDETLSAELAWLDGAHDPVLVVPEGGATPSPSAGADDDAPAAPAR